MSSTSKKDLLNECLADMGPNPPPLPEFQANFCSRCFQGECSRSLSGSSLFEQRAKNWRERLFDAPATMSPDDPRFTTIASRKFLDIPTSGQAGAPSSWVDPRDLEPTHLPVVQEPAPAPKAAKTPRKTTPKKAPKQKVVETSDSEPSGIVEVSTEASPAPKKTSPGTPLNTPFQSGTMVGSPSAPKSPSTDSWAVTPQAPVGPGVTVLTPGSKFRFGK